ncbi:MAG: ABC transporter ATP-binding protein [Pyrinomonadaceae bacterium]|nr:ABC transporter ATP-binding protein [Pyrinomonadaceae bacterium]
MKPIIQAEDLSKQYQIGAREEGYSTLRENIVGAVKAPLKRLRRGERSADELIWALKEVSFKVEPGEVVGIIGRNGAGKSTLLKILSRITKPTTGGVDLYGRVGSLLEVGTGFHPELTGRENIYLNGAILGMKRAEIERNFDDIVAFAEVEKFLDTPVKRFSSGMYVRLAFAVAAHLEPEVLIVDEVLAVGDANFQKKCLGKMGEVAKEGRTVLFVSHNMIAVKSLCGRAMLLEGGRLTHEGSVDEVVDVYLTAGTDMAKTGIIPDDAPRLGTREAKFRAVQLTDVAGRIVSQLYLGQPFRVELTFDVLKEISGAVFEVDIATLDGAPVTFTSSLDGGNPPVRLPKGRHTITLEIDVVLMPRQYTFLVALGHLDGTTIDWIERVLDFTVLRVAQSGDDSYRWTSVRGYVRPRARWHAPGLFPTALVTNAETIPEDVTVGGNGSGVY